MAATSSTIAPQPALESYLWTFPGCPVRIALDLDLVECLSRELGRSAQRETGGFLLGYADAETGRTITVSRRASLPSHFHSNRFVLSPEEISEFEAQLYRDQNSRGLRIVGYYRTHPGTQPRLSEDDVNIITQCFDDPANVFLIVNPDGGKSPVAGFFFWDHRRIFDAFSFLEFPLDRQSLGARAYSRDAPFYLTEDAPGKEPPVEALVPTIANSEYLRAYGALDQEADSAVQPAGRASLLAEILAAFLLLIAVVATLWPQFAPKSKARSGIAAPLQLSVQKEPADLRVSWDTKSPVIRAAQSGRLLIDDGSSKDENLTLGPAELQSGPVLYSLYPGRATSVRFRLEVTGAGRAVSSAWIGVTLPTSKPPSESPAPARIVASLAPVTRPNAEPASRKRFVAPPRAAAVPDSSGIALQQPPLLAPDTNGPAAALPSRTETVPGLTFSALSPPAVKGPPKPAYTAPVLLKRVAPEFPVTLQHYRLEGVRIHLLLQVDEFGRVTSGRSLTSGNKLTNFLSAIALESAKRWRFAPARLGERNVPGEAAADFVFSNKP